MALDASKLLLVVLKALNRVVYELRRGEPRLIVEVPKPPLERSPPVECLSTRHPWLGDSRAPASIPSPGVGVDWFIWPLQF